MTPSYDADPSGASAANIVSRAWAGVVGMDRFDPDDDFFALGGDSVSAAAVARKVGKATDAHVPPRALFEHPTFRDFTAFVAARRRPTPPRWESADWESQMRPTLCGVSCSGLTRRRLVTGTRRTNLPFSRLCA